MSIVFILNVLDDFYFGPLVRFLSLMIGVVSLLCCWAWVSLAALQPVDLR